MELALTLVLVVGPSVGAMIGFTMGLRRARQRIEPTPYNCHGCGDSLSYHDPKTGRCNARPYRYGAGTMAAGFYPCACLQFIGDRPMSELDPAELLRGIQDSESA